MFRSSWNVDYDGFWSKTRVLQAKKDIFWHNFASFWQKFAYFCLPSHRFCSILHQTSAKKNDRKNGPSVGQKMGKIAQNGQKKSPKMTPKRCQNDPKVNPKNRLRTDGQSRLADRKVPSNVFILRKSSFFYVFFWRFVIVIFLVNLSILGWRLVEKSRTAKCQFWVYNSSYD